MDLLSKRMTLNHKGLLITLLSVVLMLAALTVASSNVLADESTQGQAATASSPLAGELYRPQYHFTPQENWMNDPNGLLYYDGEYHLFYQHNPAQKVWGPMFWGHAVSPDLVNWQHLPIALYPDEIGHIWSGSAVIDWNNTAGFGTEAMVAIFTHEFDGQQDVSLAYSTDKGRSWSKYDSNPVMTMPDGLEVFRDPKVFWHAGANHWVMVISGGDRIYFYTSSDLKAWTQASEFGSDYGSHAGTWEVPDLFELPVDGGGTRWVLAVSTSHGAPAGGNGVQYFVGNFDGNAFTSFYSRDTVRWADVGADFYAALSWEDEPDGRRIWAAWMNNWTYGQEIPTSTWRGSLTLPRELSLANSTQGIQLIQKPVEELESLRVAAHNWTNETVSPGTNLLDGITGDKLEIVAEFQVDGSTTADSFGFNVRVGNGEETSIGYVPADAPAAASANEIENPSFETGDLTGWTASGTAFTDASVSNAADWGWGCCFDHEGEYHLWGLNPTGDAGTGELRSSTFTLGGSGEVSFLIGGGNNPDLYVALASAVDDSELITTTNTFFNDSPEYYRVVWDASAYLGQDFYIKIVDNATGGWGHINVDDFRVYNTESVLNHSFETGDITGWTTTGGAFSDGDVSDATDWGWGCCFEQDGTYHLSNFVDGGDGPTGEMRSNTFTLAGTGQIDFLIGGGNDENNLYVALMRDSDDTELMRAHNLYWNDDEKYRRIFWDASEYLDEELYIKVVDHASGGWGHINVDDFNVYQPKGVVFVNRINAGDSSFNNTFAASHSEALSPISDTIKLHIFVDSSSVEVFANDGQLVMSEQIFPDDESLGLELFAEGGDVVLKSLDLYELKGAKFLRANQSLYEMDNPDFETGDLTGWTIVSGNAFTDTSVTTKAHWDWGCCFNQNNDYHLFGLNPTGDAGTGELRSSGFILGGTGEINFLQMGGNNPNLYVSLHRVADDSELMRQENTEWRDHEMYTRYIWDASAYLGEELYIKVVDNETGGWGFIGVDDFNVYNEALPSYEIENPDFETGDISGWTGTGDFTDARIMSFWDVNRDRKAHGSHHFSSIHDIGDAGTGEMRSSTFTLAGTGEINFLISGGSDSNLLWAGLYDAATDTELMTATRSENSDVYVRVFWDASAYLGQELYIKVVDNHTGGWGYIGVDDFNVYVEANPNEIINPDFELGNLHGWTVTNTGVGDTAFRDDNVTKTQTWGWDCCFDQHGAYHMFGFIDPPADAGTGELTSSTFTLGGTGEINFLMSGGGNRPDTLYVALHRASDDSLLMKSNPATDWNTYVRTTWDASDYLGEELYIQVVDHDQGGFGIISVDDFNVYVTDTPDDIENADFETGDLVMSARRRAEALTTSGWQTAGHAFTDDHVSDATCYGGCTDDEQFNQNGTYHVWGWNEALGGDKLTGILQSNTFVLDPAGNGLVEFLVGGGEDLEKLYVALVRASDERVLFKATGANVEGYERVTWSAAAYKGQELYFKVVDYHTGAFGHINVDDFGVKNVEGEPVTPAYWQFDEGSGKTTTDLFSGIEDEINYVFNDALYQPDTDPMWREGISGTHSLLFDGYSTWIERDASEIIQPSNKLAIEVWVAPRNYEQGDFLNNTNASIIVNQHNRASQNGYMLGMHRHGTWSFQAGISGGWYQVWADEDHPLPKHEWSYIVATYDADEGKMRLYLNGTLVGETDTPLDAFISPTTADLLIGKHNKPGTLDRIFHNQMFNGLIDELKISGDVPTAAEIQATYDAYLAPYGGTAPDPETFEDRSRYDGDRYRPQYHFIPPEHWMNEPHAPLHYDGKYHIFYQKNLQGPYWQHKHWGHAVSDDMVQWEDLPVALAPDDDSIAPDGVWSGSATTDADGEPVLFFTAGNFSEYPNQSTGLALPVDPTNPLTEWTMHPTSVTTQTQGLDSPPGTQVRFGEFRDPHVWKETDANGDPIWYQLVGSGIMNEDGTAPVGGTALLYSSSDLYDWTYHGPLFIGDYATYPWEGEVWELPVLLPLGTDSQGNEKHVFVVMPWFGSYSPYAVRNVYYWLGTWDRDNYQFVPDHPEPRRFDYGDHFTGPTGTIDDNGRAILWSIAQDRRRLQEHYDSAWAHNAGLPLVLSLNEDDTLGIEPIPELANLRQTQLLSLNNRSLASANSQLAGVSGDTIEIMAELEPTTATQFGIKVRSTGDGQEETLIYVDVMSDTFNVDRNRSSLDPDTRKGIQGDIFELDGTLHLHIFVDRSMIEAYANGRKSITTRVYPILPNATGIEVWANGEVTVHSMDVWALGSAYGDLVPAYVPAPAADVPAGELPNHSFQNCDLSDWIIVEGTTFSDQHVTNVNNWGWAGDFLQAHTLDDPSACHLWGFNPDLGGDNAMGRLRSQTFVLGGDGQIDFLLSGGNDIDNLYFALVRVSDDSILIKTTSYEYPEYVRHEWDASAYIGEELYVELVDTRGGGWGHISLDDVNVPIVAPQIAPTIEGGDIAAGGAGDAATYTLTISNTATTSDTFTITCDSEWDCTLQEAALLGPLNVTLEAGESTQISAQITVPADAEAGDTNTAEITVASTNYPAATATINLTTVAIGAPEVAPALDGGDEALGLAEDVINYTLSITNPNQISETYTIDCQSDWTCAADDAQITLAGGESTDIEVSVTIPSDAEAGDTNSSDVTATSSAYPSLSANATLTTMVVGAPEVAPAADEAVGIAEEVVIYTISINNPNQIAEEYTIDCDSDWTCAADATEITLAGGESTDIEVSVTIPSDAEAGDTNSSDVTATSSVYPSLSANATLTTMVVGAPEVAPATDEAVGIAEEVVIYTVSISNPNQIAEDYTIDCQSDWTCAADETEITLGAGQSTDIEVSVTIPTDAQAGETNSSDVTATSSANPSLSATVTLTTMVVGAPQLAPTTDGGDADEGMAGDMVTVTISITNPNQIAEDYNIACQSAWTCAADDAQITLEGGESTDIEVSVTIPSDAEAGDTNSSDVTATSSVYPSLSANATLTTMVVGAPQLAPTTDGGDADEGMAGDMVTVTISITNPNQIAEDYTIDCDSDWTCTADETEVTLAGGESTEIVVSVTIPSDAQTDDTNTSNVTATSIAYPSLSATLSLTITVEGTTTAVSLNSFDWSRGTPHVGWLLLIAAGGLSVLAWRRRQTS